MIEQSVVDKITDYCKLNEIEDIKIGNNMTKYFWDGKDEFGANIGKGVYLYKVYYKTQTGKSILTRLASWLTRRAFEKSRSPVMS